MYRLHCQDQSGSFLNFIRYLKWPSQHGLGASEGAETRIHIVFIHVRLQRDGFSVLELVLCSANFTQLFLFLHRRIKENNFLLRFHIWKSLCTHP